MVVPRESSWATTGKVGQGRDREGWAGTKKEKKEKKEKEKEKVGNYNLSHEVCVPARRKCPSEHASRYSTVNSLQYIYAVKCNVHVPDWGGRTRPSTS